MYVREFISDMPVGAAWQAWPASSSSCRIELGKPYARDNVGPASRSTLR